MMRLLVHMRTRVESWQKHGPLQTNRDRVKKNKLKLYAALLVDARASNVQEGYLALGGRQPGARLMIIDEKPANIPTSLWGDYGWSTWCYTLEDVIK